jgi:hypothetical protein
VIAMTRLEDAQGCAPFFTEAQGAALVRDQDAQLGAKARKPKGNSNPCDGGE